MKCVLLLAFSSVLVLSSRCDATKDDAGAALPLANLEQKCNSGNVGCAGGCDVTCPASVDSTKCKCFVAGPWSAEYPLAGVASAFVNLPCNNGAKFQYVFVEATEEGADCGSPTLIRKHFAKSDCSALTPCEQDLTRLCRPSGKADTPFADLSGAQCSESCSAEVNRVVYPKGHNCEKSAQSEIRQTLKQQCPSNCASTQFGCCPDGKTTAMFPNNWGCCGYEVSAVGGMKGSEGRGVCEAETSCLSSVPITVEQQGSIVCKTAQYEVYRFEDQTKAQDVLKKANLAANAKSCYCDETCRFTGDCCDGAYAPSGFGGTCALSRTDHAVSGTGTFPASNAAAVPQQYRAGR